jgi:hypothetical protein
MIRAHQSPVSVAQKEEDLQLTERGRRLVPGSSMPQSSMPRSRPSMPSVPYQSYQRREPRLIMHHWPHAPVYSLSPLEAPIAVRQFHAPGRRAAISDVVLVTKAGTMITRGVMDHYRKVVLGGIGLFHGLIVLRFHWSSAGTMNDGLPNGQFETED